MNSVEVKEQVRLPLSKCLELVLSGIKFRLFRAGITVIIIALAVAFLMVMLSESLVAREVAGAIERKAAPRKLFESWVSLLTTPMTEAQLTADLAAISGPQDGRYVEFKAWGNIHDDATMSQLQDTARKQLRYMTKFFDQIKEGPRRRLVGPNEGPAIFAYLADAAHYDDFSEKLKSTERHLPGTTAEFEQFLADWKQTSPQRQAIIKGHEQALGPVKQGLGTVKPSDKLANPDKAFLDLLAQNRFQMTEQALADVKQEAAQKLDEDQIRYTLNVPLAKQRLADRKSLEHTKADFQVLFDEVSTAAGAQWMAQITASADYVNAAAAQGISRVQFGPTPLPPCPVKPKPESFSKDTAGAEAFKKAMADYDAKLPAYNTAMATVIDSQAKRIHEVAQNFLSNQNLAKVEQEVSQSASSGGVGFSGRMLWLIIVSFLVCVVGIANAMLMSVTERFREIATMKCLGATDGFIMVNFIMESVMQGVAGSIMGAVVGLILGVLRAWASFGMLTWTNFPFTQMLEAMGAGMIVGVVVSALAAVYPSYVAARLAPMEAMRIE